MKDPIQHFLDAWNEVYVGIPWTTWAWFWSAWIFAAAVLVLMSEGVLK